MDWHRFAACVICILGQVGSVMLLLMFYLSKKEQAARKRYNPLEVALKTFCFSSVTLWGLCQSLLLLTLLCFYFLSIFSCHRALHSQGKKRCRGK